MPSGSLLIVVKVVDTADTTFTSLSPLFSQESLHWPSMNSYGPEPPNVKENGHHVQVPMHRECIRYILYGRDDSTAHARKYGSPGFLYHERSYAWLVWAAWARAYHIDPVLWEYILYKVSSMSCLTNGTCHIYIPVWDGYLGSKCEYPFIMLCSPKKKSLKPDQLRCLYFCETSSKHG